MSREAGDMVAAGLAGAVLSGIPSTLDGLLRTRDPLAPALAAGALVTGAGAGPAARLAAAVPIHLAISLGWAAVLARVLPERRPAAWGAAAGLAIAALDLGVVGRRLAPIRALPQAAQVADHVAFGAVVGAVLSRRAARRTPSP
jgi:hypothetical protein